MDDLEIADIFAIWAPTKINKLEELYILKIETFWEIW